MKYKFIKESVEEFLEPKSAEDIKQSLSGLSKKELNNSLLDAAYDGYYDIVKLLLNNGADVDARSINGYTALIYASAEGYYNIVKLLLDFNANINIANYDKQNALYSALLYHNNDIAKLLKKHGAIK